MFRFDPDFEANEAMWVQIRKEIIGEGSEAEDEESGEEEEDEETAAAAAEPAMQIEDKTEMDVVNLRRTIYLTIMSNIDFEECAHKIMKLQIPKGSEVHDLAVLCKLRDSQHLSERIVHNVNRVLQPGTHIPAILRFVGSAVLLDRSGVPRRV